MQQIKRAWNNQDLPNKVILVTGVVMAVICLVMEQGLYSVIFIGLMFAFMVAHSGQRTKRCSVCTAACTSICLTARWYR